MNESALTLEGILPMASCWDCYISFSVTVKAADSNRYRSVLSGIIAVSTSTARFYHHVLKGEITSELCLAPVRNLSHNFPVCLTQRRTATSQQQNTLVKNMKQYESTGMNCFSYSYSLRSWNESQRFAFRMAMQEGQGTIQIKWE